jgi:hypothetical protein
MLPKPVGEWQGGGLLSTFWLMVGYRYYVKHVIDIEHVRRA